MKAALIERYGPPEVLVVREVADPVIGPHDVLIRQHAATVSPADCAFRSADPFIVRFFAGLTKPKDPVPGSGVAGVVEAVGVEVTRYAVGDRVFGTTDPGPGAMAELVRLPEDAALAKMPDGLEFGEAAGLTYSFLTAMPFLRDEAKLQPGQRILIHGAAGSIGLVAVQLAKHMGAEITATTSSGKMALVRSLGANRVIDRHAEDYTTHREAYDVIFDTVGKSSFKACLGALKPGGIYLTTVPSFGILGAMLARKRSDGKRGKLATTGLRPTAAKAADMAVLAELVAAGVLRGVVDRRFALADIAAAHRCVEMGTKAGDVIVDVVLTSPFTGGSAA